MEKEISMADIRQAIFELTQSQKETAAQQKETDRILKESRKETDQILKELAQSQKESQIAKEKRSEELAQSQKETDRGMKELRKQIGGLGERFGSFTEGMAINSMERILRREFKADHVSARSKIYDKTGKVVAEYDILAWCNSDVNNVVVVEVKSTLRPEYVNDFEQVLREFKTLNPELANKNLYGILAFVGNFDKNTQECCQNKGIYTATIHDEVFKLNNDKTFSPKNFNL